MTIHDTRYVGIRVDYDDIHIDATLFLHKSFLEDREILHSAIRVVHSASEASRPGLLISLRHTHSEFTDHKDYHYFVSQGLVPSCSDSPSWVELRQMSLMTPLTRENSLDMIGPNTATYLSIPFQYKNTSE